MTTITISQERFNKVLSDVEVLLQDVTSLLDKDEIAIKRMKEIKANSNIGKSEKELDGYLKKRGVKLD